MVPFGTTLQRSGLLNGYCLSVELMMKVQYTNDKSVGKKNNNLEHDDGSADKSKIPFF